MIKTKLIKYLLFAAVFALLLETSRINAQGRGGSSALILKVDSLNELSFSLRSTNPTETIIVGKKANLLAKQISYPKGILMSFSFIGVGYRNIFDYSSALHYYLKAFNLADSLNDVEQKAYALNNIGNLYYRQSKYPLAIKSINEALNLANEINDLKIVAYCYLNLGRVYAQQEKWDKTITYLQNAIKVREQLGDKWSVANTYIDIGLAIRKMKDYANAKKAFETAYKLASEVENGFSIIAEANHGFALIARDQKKYKKSNEFINKSIAVNNKINHTERIVENYNILYENYASLGNYKKAYKYFNIYNTYKDSLSSVETSKAIANLEIQYETEKKEKDNELLRQQNILKEHQISEQKLYTRMLIFVALFVIIIAFVMMFIMRQKMKLNQLLQKRNKEIEEQRAELANLNNTKDKFFSIISHDLKSPFTGLLGSVSMLDDIYDELTDEERKTIISGMHQSTKTIKELLIGLLDWARSQQDKIEFNGEIISISEIVNSLFSVYRSIAEDKKIALINKLPNNLEVYTDINILNTVLRNLIANALKFTAEDGQIKIYHSIDNNIAKIIVQDNGVGISEENQEKLFRIDKHLSTKGTANERGTGIGLILCHELITKQGGLLDVESKEGFGSKFYFTVPLYQSKEISEEANINYSDYKSAH